MQLMAPEVAGDSKKKEEVSLEVNTIENSTISEEVKVDLHLTEEWLDDFVVLNGTTEEPLKSTAKEALRKIQSPIFCAGIYKNGKIIACGLGVLEREKIGLFDIRVKEYYRRLGLDGDL